jgi:hypothetical protein
LSGLGFFHLPVFQSAKISIIFKRAVVVLDNVYFCSVKLTPNDLTEDLAMKHIQGNPQMGKEILRNLHDPRWKGWTKMTWTNESKTIEIHYNAKFNSYDRIISIDDFKFKRP